LTIDTRAPRTEAALDVAAVRREFPLLERAAAAGRPVVYLDSAATTQKPRAVLEAEREFYAAHYGAIARGVYRLSAEATALYEAARGTTARFLGADAADEIVFVRGTTEAINLVAASWGRAHLRAGDEILLTGLEHHSNIVPWQLAAEATGARLVVAPLDERGDVPLAGIERALASGRVRMAAVAHISNALGTVLPVAEIARLAHDAGALVLVDGAQSAPRRAIDVAALGCDFYVFSGHKIYGPNGVGVLWGRRELLAAMPPYQGGGGMIESVTFERTTYAPPPQRFEAGTPAGPQAHGLAAALEWLAAKDLALVAAHEAALVQHAAERLAAIAGVRLVGTPRERAGVVSFVVEGAHAHDVGTVLDAAGVAVRAGHHCAQPAMRAFGVEATVRASFGIHNGEDDVEALAAAVEKAGRMLGR
jgi:cysteine desulfurase / selenocysteine lyase